MAVVIRIPQKELRNNVGDVLRRAEAGEELVVTVAGRPVAQLGPVRVQEWVPAQRLREVWATPAPAGLLRDFARFGASLSDPYA